MSSARQPVQQTGESACVLRHEAPQLASSHAVGDAQFDGLPELLFCLQISAVISLIAAIAIACFVPSSRSIIDVRFAVTLVAGTMHFCSYYLTLCAFKTASSTIITPLLQLSAVWILLLSWMLSVLGLHKQITTMHLASVLLIFVGGFLPACRGDLRSMLGGRFWRQSAVAYCLSGELLVCAYTLLVHQCTYVEASDVPTDAAHASAVGDSGEMTPLQFFVVTDPDKAGSSHIRTRTGSPLPHPYQDGAHPFHIRADSPPSHPYQEGLTASYIRTRTGSPAPTSGDWARPSTFAPRLGPPLPHLRQDWTHPCHICTGTGLRARTLVGSRAAGTRGPPTSTPEHPSTPEHLKGLATFSSAAGEPHGQLSRLLPAALLPHRTARLRARAARRPATHSPASRRGRAAVRVRRRHLHVLHIDLRAARRGQRGGGRHPTAAEPAFRVHRLQAWFRP